MSYQLLGTDVDIINNLTSDRIDAALAAAQGKVLKSLINTLQSSVDGLGTAATLDTGTTAGTIPVLDTNGKLNTSVLPALAITEVNTVSSQSEMLALSAQVGDIAIRTDVNKTYILSKEPASTLSNWVELLFPVSVSSINGKTGAVTLTAANINATVNSVTQSIQAFLTNMNTEIANMKSDYLKAYATTITAKANSTVTFTSPFKTKNLSITLYDETTSCPLYAEVTNDGKGNFGVVFGNIGTTTTVRVVLVGNNTNYVTT